MLDAAGLDAAAADDTIGSCIVRRLAQASSSKTTALPPLDSLMAVAKMAAPPAFGRLAGLGAKQGACNQPFSSLRMLAHAATVEIKVLQQDPLLLGTFHMHLHSPSAGP